jgi:uncharacterized membrane protein
LTIERTATIARPIEDVYAFLTDLSQLTKWREDVISNERVSPPGPLDGATFREVLKTPIGPQTVTVEITAKENERFGFKVIDGMLRPQGSVDLKAVPEGTLLAYRVDLKPMLGAPSPLDAAAGAFLTKSIERSMELLKALLEK